MQRRFWILLGLMAVLGVSWPTQTPIQAATNLPAIVLVARAHLATPDYIFRRDLGPPGQLTTGIDGFAPGSKLLLREPNGTLRVLIDTSQPAGHPLNPLGLRDLNSPDVSFDASRIVFAGTFGPEAASTSDRPRFSWRIFEMDGNGSIRQLTFSDRQASIPQGPGNATFYQFYDDLFPAYLADGRIVFSSSRYPSRAHYDGRPTFNLYTIGPSGENMQRITTERGGALHPTPLPDGRILWSRWWVNFNQPSETGIYQRIDNGTGSEIARDQQGQIITIERRITVRNSNSAAAPAATAVPTPWRPTSIERVDPATGGIYRVTVTPLPAQARPAATAAPRATPVPGSSREVTVRVPVTGYRLPDGTLIYSNTLTSFNPARGRLPDGAPIRDAPNTWHLMAINADGSHMQRYAWTPRYASEVTDDSGQDTFNAAQPAIIQANGQLLVAYVSQRDGTMAHSSLQTGIRVAKPGLLAMAENTTESIAGMRWASTNRTADGHALRPTGLPDGRILYSQSVADPQAPQQGSYRYNQAGRTLNLTLQGAALRYELRVIQPDGSSMQVVPINADLQGYDLIDAKPMVIRPVGDGPGQWKLPLQPLCAEACPPTASDNPLDSNVPRGLVTASGSAAYPWSQRRINDVSLTVIHNPNVYANPPLEYPYVNNSPPIGSVAYAEVYIDAPQFTGASYRAEFPDDQVRAIKWLTVPVNLDGSFTASVPSDVPNFIVLRDKQGRIVRAANRSSLSIAQGNAPGRPGEVVQCVGCHMGHVSGSLDGQPLAAFGWTNVAPAARVSTSSGSEPGRLIDRRGYVPAGHTANGPFRDRTPPWIAAGSRGEGESIQLTWELPLALLDIRLVGAEPGQEGFSQEYVLAGELRFFLNGTEISSARQVVGQVAPLSRGGTTIQLPKPIAADRVEFVITDVRGTRNGAAAPAALSEIEVIAQGASAESLAGRPSVAVLPMVEGP
ncbi:MAG: hypothetical protein OHK0050_00660 [Roseiflexaceae bacterium]